MSTAPVAATTSQTYQLYVRAAPALIWDAIVQPRYSAGYLFGALVETTGEVGTPFRYQSPDRTALWGDETVLDADPPTRLVVSYRGLYNPDLAAEPASRVSWLIEAADPTVSLLTVIHDRLDESPRTAASVAGPRWMRVLSGLKTLLETGHPLND